MQHKLPFKSLSCMSTKELPDLFFLSEWDKKYSYYKPHPVLYYENKTADPFKSNDIPVPATVEFGILSNADAISGEKTQVRLFEIGKTVPIRYHVFPAKEFPEIVQKFDLKIDWECSAFLDYYAKWRRKVELDMKLGFDSGTEFRSRKENFMAKKASKPTSKPASIEERKRKQYQEALERRDSAQRSIEFSSKELRVYKTKVEEHQNRISVLEFLFSEVADAAVEDYLIRQIETENENIRDINAVCQDYREELAKGRKNYSNAEKIIQSIIENGPLQDGFDFDAVEDDDYPDNKSRSAGR